MFDEYSAILNKEINAALVHDRRIRARASGFRAALLGERIIVEGEVEDLPSKRIACNLVHQFVGDGYRVTDRLRVRAGDIDDAALRERVAQALLTEPEFGECNILVECGGTTQRLRGDGFDAGGLLRFEVADGVVTLTGQLASLTGRRLAEVLAWWIDGCQRVDNLLEVVPPRSDSDAELLEAVRMVLRKDPMIDTDGIRVAVEAGVVELAGRLTSEEQSIAAAWDVWAVPGVWEVYNHLEADRALA